MKHLFDNCSLPVSKKRKGKIRGTTNFTCWIHWCAEKVAESFQKEDVSLQETGYLAYNENNLISKALKWTKMSTLFST